MQSSETISVRHWDGHVHGRLMPVMGPLLGTASHRMCGGALEPNTAPEFVLTYEDAVRYHEQANKLTPGCPWAVSIFLTKDTKLEDVERAWRAGILSHVKRYPPNASTHSADGPSEELLLDRNSNVGKVLCGMEERSIPFKAHAEIATWKGEEVAAAEREDLYYKEFARRFHDTYKRLGIINAHLTTTAGVKHMEEFGDPDSYVCEVTGHHLAHHHAALHDGGFLLPCMHCLPVLKSKYNWRRVRNFVAKGHRYIMLHSDMAYHPIDNKFAFQCMGGLGTYHCSLELFVQMLDELDALQHADNLLYGNAKRFYGDIVPDNPQRIKLVRDPWTQDEKFYWGDKEHIPFGWHPDPKKRFPFQFRIAA